MNILEQKRKLLGHCYMGGGGSSGSGGGGLSNQSENTRNALRSNEGYGSTDTGGGSAPVSGGRDSAAQARESAEAAATEAANRQAEADRQAEANRQAIAEADRQAQAEAAAQATREQAARDAKDAQMAAEQASREQAARDAQAESDRASAAAEAARAVEAKNAAAASLNQAAVVNPALSAFTGVSLSNSQQAALDKKTASNEVRDAVTAKLAEMSATEKYNQLKYGFDATNDPAAKVEAYKSVMGDLTKQEMKLGANKNGEDRVVSVDVPANSWVDAFGASPSYAEAKALQAAGLGNITGVNANNLTSMNTPVQGVEGLFTNDPGQTADSVVAATDFTNFVGPIAKAAAMFIPGMSLAMTIKDFADGKITVGDIASNFALGLLAKQFGISAATAKAMINGDFGSAIASTMIGQLNPALAKELGVNPALAGILGQTTGAYGAINSAFSGLNQNWGTTKSIANGFNDALKGIGITTGTGGQNGATGQSINTGFTTQDAIDHYISGGGGGSSNAPAATPATPAPTAPTKTPTTTPTKAPTTGGKTSSSSLDALGAAAFGLSGVLGSSGSSGATASTGSTNYGNSSATSLSSVAPLSLSSSFQTKVIPNQPKFQGALEEFNQLQQSDDPNAVQLALSDQLPQGNDMTPYTYGVDRPIEDILSPEAVAMQDVGYSPDGVPEYMKTGIQAAKGGAMTGTRYGKYARGGLSTPLMASGGKMRVDFRHGDAVTGAGDGQSDDIPAMLADGEFVFPADVVAAIGNGSTKAGSDKLYNMMHGIRAHVRSAKPRDLPPEIKSPLDFLKKTKRQGAKHG